MWDKLQRDDWQKRILESYHECCSPKLDHVINPLTSLALQGIKCQIVPHSGHQYGLLYPTVAVSNQRGNYKPLAAGMTIQPEIETRANAKQMTKLELISVELCIINIWTHIDHHTHTHTLSCCSMLAPLSSSSATQSKLLIAADSQSADLPSCEQCFNNKSPSIKRSKK